MAVHAEKAGGSFLVRLRNQDTPTSVTPATIDRLTEYMGLTKTEIVHLALRQFADRFLPRYELDDGPLTEVQLEAIKAASPVSEIPSDKFADRLF
ncbi:hypothetical protein [Asticcacaulis sp. YBE204]|uniref:hypothetical protein n=1 Tax=Asticcacaulis sp. YBE204 TaxID=1282363 RepID=UPI0003C3E172|nr:hypothetical protein [Asticcacaulis sp. YBE204]ESQ79262.1 hypothetical protein AEYBE204_09640 [Asticcacaulis sp. YBE204]